MSEHVRSPVGTPWGPPGSATVAQGDGAIALTTNIETAIEPIAREWDALADTTDASPFHRPGWFAAWWRTFGEGELAIVVAREGHALVGVLPLLRRRGCLRSLTNSETPFFGAVATSPDVCAQLIAAALGTGARRVELDDVLSSSDTARAWTDVVGQEAVRAGERELARSPYVLVDGSWERYLETHPSARKLEKKVRRNRRRLEGSEELTLEVHDGLDQLQACLTEGFAVEASGWKAEAGTAIASRLPVEQFYREVGAWAAERGWLRLLTLRSGKTPIAFWYDFEHGGCFYTCKTGYDEAYGTFSPGVMVTSDELQISFSSGLDRVELLGSDEPYKLAWADGAEPVLRYRAYRRSVAGSADWFVDVHGRDAASRARSRARGLLARAEELRGRRAERSDRRSGVVARRLRSRRPGSAAQEEADGSAAAPGRR